MATSSAAYDFDGTDDVLQSNNTTTYNFTTQDFTVLAWAFNDVNSGHLGICGNSGSAATGWGFKSIDGVTGNITLTKVGIADINSGLAITQNTWQGIAAVVDVSTNVVFYRMTNAGVVSTATTNNTSNINSSTADLQIGNNGRVDFFNGAIKYVQIFNRLLTRSEVECALLRPGSVANGLIGFWPVWGQLNPDTDLSITGSDGTTSGTPGTRAEATNLAIPVAGFLS